MGIGDLFYLPTRQFFFVRKNAMREKVVKGAKKTSLLCFYLYSLFPEKWDCLDLGHGE